MLFLALALALHQGSTKKEQHFSAPNQDKIDKYIIYIFKYILYYTQGFPLSFVLCPFVLLRHAQGTPPWILKRAGLESSG